jgi:hypothetical protein
MRAALLGLSILAFIAPVHADIIAGGGGSSSSSGATTALDNLAAVAVNAHIVPGAAGTIDLGSTAKPFRSPYLTGPITWVVVGDPTNEPRIVADPNQTSQPITIGVGSSGARHVIVADAADINVGFNFAVGATTNPTLVVASANQTTNERVGVRHNQTQGQLVDLAATATSQRPISLHGGGTVASAATITPTGNVFHVSGTTQINTITVMGSGSIIILIFDAATPVGDSVGNVNIGAAFTATAGDTLTLVSDGTSWYEVGRSVN